MASSINFNTVWTSIFEPLPTFGFLDRMARESESAQRHARDEHIVGLRRIGRRAPGRLSRPQLEARRPGHRAVQLRRRSGSERPQRLDARANQKIWGFETNFGALADLSVVKANQLMPKPTHLSWEESAVNGLCSATSYRMLVSDNGARMKQGDSVLIWGATGGIGGYAVQYVLNGGGTPIGVVSSPERAEILNRMGCEAVIDRKAANYQFWSDEHTQDEKEWRRFGKDIRNVNNGEDVDIVFEHPGRSTMGASVFAAKRGGTIVTCAATSGYMVEFDNRHFWMKLKQLVSSHFANYAESWAANKLLCEGKIQPLLTDTYTLEQVGEASLAVHQQQGRRQARRAVSGSRRRSRRRRPRTSRGDRRRQDQRVQGQLNVRRAHCSA